MERHNNERKYEQYSKIVAWLYVIAGAGIVILPFFETYKGYTILGYKSPYTFAFSILAGIGLVRFGLRYFKNDNLVTLPFDFKYAGGIAILSLIVFLLCGDFLVDAYRESGKQGALSEIISGEAHKLAFWWGPFVYCACLGGASYFSFELNKIINEMKEGIF